MTSVLSPPVELRSGPLVYSPGLGRGRYVERDLRPGVIERTWVEEGAPLPPPPVDVALSARALDTIKHRAFWQTGQDGCETGGMLFGIGLLERAVVVQASAVGPLATRERAYLGMDTGVFHCWDVDTEVRRIGCWHTHPDGADGDPSEADIAAMRAGFERANREAWQPNFVSLIVTRGESGWARPTFHGWTIDARGELERATVSDFPTRGGGVVSL